MKNNKSRKSSSNKATNKTSAAVVAVSAAGVSTVNVPTVAAIASKQVEAGKNAAPVQQSSLVLAYIEQLRTGELASRIAAAAKLGELADHEATLALQNALRDPTAEVAREAAVALGKTGQSSAVEALSAVLKNADGFYHSIVRIAAADSLAQLKDRRAVPALSAAVRDPFAEPSRAAVRALACLARDEAVPVLIAVANNADGYFLPTVRLAAIEALAISGNASARECLRGIAANPSEDSAIRQSVKSV